MRHAKQNGSLAEFTVYSRGEQNQAACRRHYPEAHYVLGDVRDVDRLALAMLGHDTVIHAAALKFIPEGEFNASECVRVNVDGARAVIAAARMAGVRRVVGISTDKAAQPVNVYGMTKAIMERLFAEAADIGGGTTFTTCRYGNVIGSTGSVVPVMMRQLLETGCVNVTDLDMTRFWMSYAQAADTIGRALRATPGSITVPQPFAASMANIALAICNDLGRINVIGKRPGEKQHEDLISHYEMYRARLGADGWYEILPPGYEDYSHECPTLSSDSAQQLTRRELEAMIEDSIAV
jgi:FlaA1/EpsC-like NDP-sugar epimerase